MTEPSLTARALELHDNLSHAIALNKAMMTMTYFGHDLDELHMSLERHLQTMLNDSDALIYSLVQP